MPWSPLDRSKSLGAPDNNSQGILPIFCEPAQLDSITKPFHSPVLRGLEKTEVNYGATKKSLICIHSGLRAKGAAAGVLLWCCMGALGSKPADLFSYTKPPLNTWLTKCSVPISKMCKTENVLTLTIRPMAFQYLTTELLHESCWPNKPKNVVFFRGCLYLFFPSYYHPQEQNLVKAGFYLPVDLSWVCSIPYCTQDFDLGLVDFSR